MFYNICDDIVEQDFETSVILYVVQNNSFYLLEDTGYFLWKLIKNNNSLELIVEIMVKTYNISKKQAILDIKQFVENLIKIGVLLNEEK